MVNADERDAFRPGDALCGRDADEQRADEARAVPDRDGVEVVQRGVGLGEGLLDDGEDAFDMGAARDLGDDPAVLGVQVLLEATTLDRTATPSSTIDAAVSSQDDSMPRIRTLLSVRGSERLGPRRVRVGVLRRDGRPGRSCWSGHG
jgi:hypothetical protein